MRQGLLEEGWKVESRFKMLEAQGSCDGFAL